MWDSTTLQCKRTLEGHEDNVRVLTVGSRHVFSGSWDKTIRVWDIDTLECIKVRPVAPRRVCWGQAVPNESTTQSVVPVLHAGARLQDRSDRMIRPSA